MEKKLELVDKGQATVERPRNPNLKGHEGREQQLDVGALVAKFNRVGKRKGRRITQKLGVFNLHMPCTPIDEEIWNLPGFNSVHCQNSEEQKAEVKCSETPLWRKHEIILR